MPVTATTDLAEEAVLWLAKYNISIAEALRAGFRWEPELYQLLFPMRDLSGQLVCVQARNFSRALAKKAKYYNVGDKDNHFTIYGKGSSNMLVLTEDVVSSLKIGRQSDAMPLLGTSISKNKLAALRPLYDELLVWLDEDKWDRASAIAESAKMLGFEAYARFTPLDPKEYSDEAIAQLIL